eukprot:199658_1
MLFFSITILCAASQQLASWKASQEDEEVRRQTRQPFHVSHRTANVSVNSKFCTKSGVASRGNSFSAFRSVCFYRSHAVLLYYRQGRLLLGELSSPYETFGL